MLTIIEADALLCEITKFEKISIIASEMLDRTYLSLTFVLFLKVFKNVKSKKVEYKPAFKTTLSWSPLLKSNICGKIVMKNQKNK
jgi:hypothetical protein